VLRSNTDGDIQFVTYLITKPAATPWASTFTKQYDIYSWVLIAISQQRAETRAATASTSGRLTRRKDWMQIEPQMGTIAAGESQDFVVTLDAADPSARHFPRRIVFTHDGVGGETLIPVTLSVVEGRCRLTDLEPGWAGTWSR
jgi:hypothetical protein